MSRRRDGLRDRWRAEVYRSQLIGDACRVLLLKLADTMTDRGVVSVPQDRLADALGVDGRRVKARIAEARKAGLLDKLGGGYRGRTAEYVAVMPSVMGTAQRTPFTGKGAVLRHPLNGPLSGADLALMGTAQRPPNARAYLDGSRERHDDERELCVVPDDSEKQERSDERAPLNLRIAALSTWAQLTYAPLLGRTA